jgi:PAS domain-containing protein
MTKRIVRSDGELRVIRYIGVPIFENDIVTRFIGTLTEITEQETATQELRRSQAYREQAEALSHTGSFGWNLSSRELVCSDEIFRILKYS